jgi:hypothetical protein
MPEKNPSMLDMLVQVEAQVNAMKSVLSLPCTLSESAKVSLVHNVNRREIAIERARKSLAEFANGKSLAEQYW